MPNARSSAAVIEADPAAESRIERALAGTLDTVCIVCILGCFSDVIVSVFFRYVLNDSLAWSEEVARWLLLSVGFLGAAVAYRRGEHIGVAYLRKWLPAAGRPGLDAGIALVVAAFCLVVCSVELVQYMPVRMTITLPGTGLPQGIFSIPMIAGMAATAFFALGSAIRSGGRAGLFFAALAALGVAAAAGLAHGAIVALDANPLLIAWIVFFATLFLGFPTAFAMGLAGCSYLVLTPQLPLFFLAQQMESGIDSFVLIAVPLFILTGKLQERTSVSDRLLDLVKIVLGRVRGGMGLVTVGGMYLFSGISGSPAADVSAVGSVMVPPLRKQGYSDGEAVGIIAAATVMGHTIPPSIGIIVLAQIASLSVGTLFVAGFVPAATLAVVLAGFILIRAYRLRLEPNPPLTLQERWRILLRGLPSLTVPVVLFGGLFTGIVTPTEVAALAVLVSILVAGLVLRDLDWRRLLDAARDAASLTGVVLLLLATANTLAFASVDQELPQAIAGWVADYAGGQWQFLLISFGVLIVMGAFLEFPALFIFGPLLIPVAATLGFHPIHYAICLIIALTIGHFLPPVGILFYVACGVAGTTAERATRPTLIYLAINAIGLLVVGFVPWLTLALPHQVGLLR